MFHSIATFLAGVGMVISSFFHHNTQINTVPVATPSQSQVVGSTQPINGMTYSLAGSGISSSASSIILTSLTIPQSGQPIQDSDLSTTFYITVEAGNRTRQEVISCTTVVQNGSGTATLSGCLRGLSPVTPYTASTTLAFSHAGGSSVVFGDAAQLFNQYAALDNTNAFTGANSFSTAPTTSDNCNATGELCNYDVVSAVANQGAATSTKTNGGIVELATGGEASTGAALVAAKPLVLDTSISTSTCQVAQNSVLVSSSTTGKLGGNCLDTGYNYTLTGNNTFTGTSTMATSTMASTTVKTLNITSLLSLNGNSVTSVLLASTTATTTIATSSVTVDSGGIIYNILHAYIFVPALGGTGNGLTVQFNGDNGSNYSWNTAIDAGAPLGGATQKGIMIYPSTMPSVGFWAELVIRNVSTFNKPVVGYGMLNAGTAQGNLSNISGVWNNTAPITSISLGSGVISLPVGTNITIKGEN